MESDYMTEQNEKKYRGQEVIKTEHNSENNAHYIKDYPYGFKRTLKRVWIETNKKKGDRVISQTLNPKTEQWNKPKKSTYTTILVLVKDTENGHINNLGICTSYTSEEEQKRFVLFIGEDYKLNEHQAEQMKMIKALNNARKHIKVTVSAVPNRTPEEQAKHDQQQAEQKKRINRLINHELHKQNYKGG